MKCALWDFLNFTIRCYKYCYIGNNVKVKIQSSNSLETIAVEEEPENDNIINAEILSLDECEEEIEHKNIETSTPSTTAYSSAQYVVIILIRI